MKMRMLLGVLALLWATSAWAGDMYIGGTAFEYPATGGCTPTVRVGMNHKYTVAACAAGQSFLIHAIVPIDAESEVKIHPEITWEAQSSQANYVCWNVRFVAAPRTTGVAGSPSAFSLISFASAAVSAPIAAQPNQFSPNLTGDDNFSATDLSNVRVWDASHNANCAFFGVPPEPRCNNAVLVAKITRAGPCTFDGPALSVTADALMVHLIYDEVL